MTDAPSPSLPLSPSELSGLSGPAQKLLYPAAPPKMKEMAARGIAPGIKPGEMIAVLLVLASGESAEPAATAKKTLAALPEQLLAGALASDLLPPVIDALSKAYEAAPTSSKSSSPCRASRSPPSCRRGPF